MAIIESAWSNEVSGLVATEASFLYWHENNASSALSRTVRRVPIGDISNANIEAMWSASYIKRFAYDETTGRFYFGAEEGSEALIKSILPDATDEQLIFNSGLSPLNTNGGIQVDIMHEHLLYRPNNSLRKVKTDGTGDAQLRSQSTMKTDVAWHPDGPNKYYMCFNSTNVYLFDGASQLAQSSTSNSRRIQVDHAANMVFVRTLSTIWTSDLTFGGETAIKTGLSTSESAFGIAIDTTNQKVYYCPAVGSFHRCNYDGSDDEELATGISTAVSYMAFKP